MIRIATTFMLTLLLAVLPASAIDFLGVELCQGSVDTRVKFSPGSSLVLESVEIGDSGGLVMLLSARSGKVLWSRHVGALAASSPAWSGGHVFMVANSAGSAGISSAGPGSVYCLEAKTGRVIWRKHLA